MESLRHLIERAGRLFREKRAEYYAQLQPGADEEALGKAVSYYGFRLPEALRALYSWKNGQGLHCYESFKGVDNLSFMPLKEGMEAHRIFEESDRAGEFSEGWWKSARVPFLANGGGGDHVCMDGRPWSVSARLFWFFHDDAKHSEPDLYSIEVMLEVAIGETES